MASTKKEASGADNFFYLVCLIGFFGIFSTTISKSPVLPLMVKNGFHGSDELLGLISAFSPLAGVLLSLPIGVMIDRHGYKNLFRLAACFFVGAPLGYIFIQNPYWLIPLRFLHGVATAILGPTVTTAIALRYEKSKGAKLGVYSSATLVGRTIAPTVGGLVIAYLAARQLDPLVTYKGVYLVAFLASLPVLVFAFLLPGSSSTTTGVPRLTFGDLWAASASFFRNRLLFSTAGVEMATYFAYGIMETFLPVYMSSLGYGAGEIGMVFSVEILAIALTKPVFGRLADTVDKRWQIMSGILLLGAASFFLVSVRSYALLLLVASLFSLGMAISTAATSIYVADLVVSDRVGSSMGALSAIMDIGQSAGPLLAGMLITAFASVAVSFNLALAVCLLSAGCFAYFNFHAGHPDRAVA